MRSIWLIFGFLLLTLLGLGFYLHSETTYAEHTPPIILVSQHSAKVSAGPPPPDSLRASIVRFALRQRGIPYLYAGSSPASGFDCSGFLQYVYGHFGVATPHSTALLISAGQPVPRAQAQPGDLIVFTGTAEGSTTPGHAGIVISALGETPLRFVHASSARRESGVKISQVENSGYERRFMQVRRVLGVGSPANAPSESRLLAASSSRPAAVAALPATPATPVTVSAAPLPTTVAPVALRPRWRAAATQSPRAKTKANNSATAARRSVAKASTHKVAKTPAASPRSSKARGKKPAAPKAAKPASKAKTTPPRH